MLIPPPGFENLILALHPSYKMPDPSPSFRDSMPGIENTGTSEATPEGALCPRELHVFGDWDFYVDTSVHYFLT